ncbi:MAG: aminotransferase class V-fold PLP-dependent enzyme [Candidatus Dormiibacterota bacterium]
MSGRHFLQIPGPTNVPQRVRLAMDQVVFDHRGPEMPGLVHEVVAGLRRVFKSAAGEIVLYPGSGTAAWEASIVNTIEPGDRVLVCSNGHFSHLFAECARRLGADVDEMDLDWRAGVPAELVEKRLVADHSPEYRAVLLVHNETSTGATTDIAAVRRAIDAAGHPALLIVDTVSSLASIDVRCDEWQVDVALTGAQKGLMLPPGMGLLCVGPRALARSTQVRTPRCFLDWGPVIEQSHAGFFPYTPATLHLLGLREALRMLLEEGLEQVFARHARLGEAVRQAVPAWGMDLLCRNPTERSATVSAILVPADVDVDAMLRTAEEVNLSLGTGLGRLHGRVFRIGHLGALNELEVLATLAGVELVLRRCGASVRLGSGVAAAAEYLSRTWPAMETPLAG